MKETLHSDRGSVPCAAVTVGTSRIVSSRESRRIIAQRPSRSTSNPHQVAENVYRASLIGATDFFTLGEKCQLTDERADDGRRASGCNVGGKMLALRQH